MIKKIAVLDGDGIGPEVVAEAKKVLDTIGDHFGHTFTYTHCLVGAAAIDATNEAISDETLAICKDSDAVLFGAIGDPKYDNDPSAKIRPEQGLLKLRKELGLFTNIRPVKAYDAFINLSPLKSNRIKGVDFVIFRELTGGIYFGERQNDNETAYDKMIYQKHEIERVAIKAFELAQKRKNKVTLVDKANVLDSSRLWRSTVTEVAKNYPDVTLEYLFVDNAAMQIILNPAQFDVMLTGNMFGDILSDEASVIGGSIGLLPSSSLGESTAMYEPVHGSFPQGAGKNIANPVAAILSAAMMLEDWNLVKEANAIREAIDACFLHNQATQDLIGEDGLSCSAMGNAICQKLGTT